MPAWSMLPQTMWPRARQLATTTWTSRVLGDDRASLSKTRNSGKIAPELQPMANPGQGRGADDLIVRRLLKQTYRQLSLSRVIRPRLTSLRVNPSGERFSSDSRNRTLQNADDSFAAIWDGRDDQRGSLFSSARQRCRPGCEFRRTDRSKTSKVSDPKHGHIDKRGLLRRRARSASS